MPKVHEYPILPSLTATTELYTQRRSSVEAPANYRLTLSAIAAFLESFFNIYRVRGIYASDAAAAAAGVTIGQLYEAAAGHLDGLPEGTLKIRRQ